MLRTISPGSYWLSSAGPLPTFPAASGGKTVDVIVIGAGITGLTAADLLSQAGKSVVVLEANQVGGGTSGGTSAHLDCNPEVTAGKLISAFGREDATAAMAG